MKTSVPVSSKTARAALIAAFSAATFLAAMPAMAQEKTDPLKQSPGQKTEEQADPLDNKADVQATLKEETDIIRSLAPFADGNPNAPPREVRDVDSDDGKVRVDYSRAIDITVFFAYDSDKLTPEARIQLEPLGKALQSKELMGYRFLIAGHTDSAGGAGYNRSLSLARAATVRSFLVSGYGIDPERLVIHGWGESKLKDPDAPRSSVNRRVEVALIMPNSQGGIDDLPGQALSTSDLNVDFDAVRELLREAQRMEWLKRIETRLTFRQAPVWRATSNCGSRQLTDPRLRLDRYALDDFGAMPTYSGCATASPRWNASYDARTGQWLEHRIEQQDDDDFAE